MKPKRIILIRHGESIGNIDRAVYERIPDYKLNLSVKGKEQARSSGKSPTWTSQKSSDAD